MRVFPRPIIVISKCIEFEPVRWDGSIISSEFVKQLKPHVDFVPVCPEVGAGLGVPRKPLRIVKKDGGLHLMQPATDRDFTRRIVEFSDEFLAGLGEVDGFILKSKSPTSGFRDARIYPPGEKVAALGRGPGFFGMAVLERFPDKAIEDELRLLNGRIREHFLTKIFAFADFRSVKKSGLAGELVAFQARNKLLLTAYSQVQLRFMGRIVAERKKRPFAEVCAEYEIHLYEAFRRPPKRSSNYNVLTKSAGYFSHQLTREEKAFFLASADKYKSGLLPLSAPLSVLRSWIIRFNEEYLDNQTFFEPFPESLVASEGSGSVKERDYWNKGESVSS